MGRRWCLSNVRAGLLALALGSTGLPALIAVPPVGAASPVAGLTIVLNPEEGGNESGGIAGGVEEKDINLPTTLDVGALLTQEGARVVYTRRTDVTVSLQARAALANQVQADAFITIAANALNDPNFSGVITFYGKSSGYVGGQTRPANLVAASRDLAQAVQNGVLQASGEVDQGIQSADFYVLGYSKMPSILIETGFMTNPPELRQLTSPAYQQIIAQGIVSGIEQYFSGPGSAQGAGAAETPAPSDGTGSDSAGAAAPDLSFSPFWVETTGTTKLWNTADATATAIRDLGQWTYLQVTGPQTGGRIPVTVAPSDQQGFVDAGAVGPSGPPPPDYTPPSVQPPFRPFWVETTQATALYSGPGDPSATFGVLAQWSPLLVLAPQQGPRFYVRNPATAGTAYVSATAIGPSGPPSAAQGANRPTAPASNGAATVAASSAAPPSDYVVRVGDTVSSIGRTFGVSVAAIVRANDLANPNDIVVGTTLAIPGAAPVFHPFWVENFAAAPLWSGIDGKAVQLGVAPQFTPLKVMAPAQNNRYPVRVWTTGGLAYIATNVVGPVGAPKGA